jgi:chemotaxis protein methyltransferase CheR
MIHEAPFAAEFAMSDADFERIRSLIEMRAGIQLSESKRSMVYNRLARRLRDTGCPTFAKYLEQLLRPGSSEWQSFVNALTTNLTSFFREAYHFPILAEFLKKRVAQQGSVSIWCSAASTGEEPYSIAMTALEALGPKPAVRVFASDIDTEVLAEAREGVYAADAVAKLDAQRLRRFFFRGVGDNQGWVRVRPEVSALIRFAQVNLISDEWALDERFDVIFCRNVMIYFDRQTRQNLVTRFHGAMKPEGLLFVGHSESFNDSKVPFTLMGRTVYLRQNERGRS